MSNPNTFGDLEVFAMMHELSFTSSSHGKIDILKKYYSKHDYWFAEFWRLCLSYEVVFGINEKTFSMNEGNFSADEKFRFDSIIELMQYLENESSSAIKHKRMVLGYRSTLDPFEEQLFFDNIITRNLRVGVDVKTVNKVLYDHHEIPVFNCSLAMASNKVTQFPVPGRGYYIEPKLDGVRCLAIVKKHTTGYTARLFTRNGKPILGFEDIIEELEIYMAPAMNKFTSMDSFVFDGEIMVSGKFKDTMENLFTHSKNKQGVYNIFDAVTLEVFIKERAERPLFMRKNDLSIAYSDIFDKLSSIALVSGYYIYPDDPDVLLEIESAHSKYLEQGYEGVMVKDATMPYVQKRGAHWIKFKKFHTEDFEIVGVFPGKGKYSKTLGGLIVNVYGTNVEVGSGFTDEQRDEYWQNINDIIGNFCEVKYQEIIPESGSLRFPVFVRIRYDL